MIHGRFQKYCLLLSLVLVATVAQAGDEQASDSIADIGLALEAARALPAAERTAAVTDLRSRIENVLDDGVEDNKKTAAKLLAAEVAYTLGDFRRAAEWFEDAADEGDKTPYVDDAIAGYIQSLEAMGKDSEAAKKWEEWVKRYGEGPLAAELAAARAWNAVRLDSLADARRILDEAVKAAPWMVDDPRIILARSTLAFIEGRHSDVVAKPVGSPVDDAAMYLSALNLSTQDQTLKAAARYQELVDRFPESRLRDRAMLAKANVFLQSGAYKSAVEEFERVAERAEDAEVVAEARMRHAASTYLAGDVEKGREQLRRVATEYHETDTGARAQMLLAEATLSAGDYEAAIVEFNRVLTTYFRHALAASAQYRVGRCLDALGRHAEATSTYQAVVSGYTTSREAPAAAYLAGAGLLTQDSPQAAIPFFQLVLDRYAGDKGEGTIEFATPERRELCEAALCLLQLSYHRTGNLGVLSGMPHLMLQRMPPSDSKWRAFAILIDSDALASQGRHEEAREALETLVKKTQDAAIAIPAHRLLAWSYAQSGELDLAARTEEQMLARFGGAATQEDMGSAYLNRAHLFFNEKKYKQAAKAYEDFIARFPAHEQHTQALHQAGLCYLRLGQDGDAVDRWETIVAESPTDPIAEQAWVRAGDIYFRANHFEDAKRCYRGLLENFAGSKAAAVGWLRIAQSEYNAGNDADAVTAFSEVITRFPDHPATKDAQKGIERALYRLGRGEDVTVLEQLVEQFPTSSFAADAQFEIGMRRYKDEQYAEAAEEFRSVITQFPSYSAGDKALYLMADAYTRAGDAENASQAYEQFVSFFPNSEYLPQVRLRLGVDRFAAGQYMSAAVEFSSVLQDSISSEVEAAAKFNLGLCKKMLGEADEAMDLFMGYREKFPNDERAADVAQQIGELHEAGGRDEEATGWYKRALKAPTTPSQTAELCYRLGMCRERLGNLDGALRAYQGAVVVEVKSDPYRLSALARTAVLHEQNENYRKAIAAYLDLAKNAGDPEVVVAAKERAKELENVGKSQ
jgi:TolA-binding protein